MIVTRPHKNIIRIYLNDVERNILKKAYNYLIEEGCVKTQYVEPFYSCVT